MPSDKAGAGIKPLTFPAMRPLHPWLYVSTRWQHKRHVADTREEFEGSFFSHTGDTDLIYTYIYLVIYTRLSSERIHERYY